ncbi:divergent protein kinase domain 1B-like [Branchiostoma lanceolatum]|uniref:divergent protein kinase domain 1B-like n=1 Tax=Branchiostoma lanceolatum TaxID=7740 RepID=UPI0034519F30
MKGDAPHSTLHTCVVCMLTGKCRDRCVTPSAPNSSPSTAASASDPRNKSSTCPGSTGDRGSHDQAEVILKFSSPSWYEMVAQSHHLEDTYLNYSYLIEKQARDICMKEFVSNESCHNFGQRTVLYADGDSDGEVSQSEFSNMFSLLMQREFFMLLALNDSESTLDILGYCGGFYAVQKIKYPSSEVFGSDDHILDVLPTFVLDDISEILAPALGQYGEHAAKYLDHNFRQVRVPGWQERVDFINQTFGILYDFSSQYGTAVRCCDSHLGNYGISDTGRVKYIDMDAVMSTNAALLDLSYRQCQTDEDCGIEHYEDCSSTCDEERGRCRDVMKQDDLHNFCTSTMSPVLLDRTVVSDLGVDKKLFKQVTQLVRECEGLPLFTTVEEFREKGILYVWNKFNRILRAYKTVQ